MSPEERLDLKLSIADRLEDAKGLFRPGVRVAFVAWFPGLPERDVVVTDGTMDEIAEVIRRRIAGYNPPPGVGRHQPSGHDR